MSRMLFARSKVLSTSYRSLSVVTVMTVVNRSTTVCNGPGRHASWRVLTGPVSVWDKADEHETAEDCCKRFAINQSIDWTWGEGNS